MSSQDRTGNTVIQLKGQIADADSDARAAEEQQRARLFAFAEFRNEMFVFEMDLLRGNAILTDALIAKMARVVTEFHDIRESMADRTADGAVGGNAAS